MTDLLRLKIAKEEALVKVLNYNRMFNHINELLTDRSLSSEYSTKELIELFDEFYRNCRQAQREYGLLDDAYELAKIRQANNKSIEELRDQARQKLYTE